MFAQLIEKIEKLAIRRKGELKTILIKGVCVYVVMGECSNINTADLSIQISTTHTEAFLFIYLLM